MNNLIISQNKKDRKISKKQSKTSVEICLRNSYSKNRDYRQLRSCESAE